MSELGVVGTALETALLLLPVLGGLLLPEIVRSVPEHVASGPLPEGEPEPPTYAEVAAMPGLRLLGAVLGALASVVVAVCVAPGWAWGYLLPVTPLLVALAVIDARTRLLPTRLVLPATGLVLVVAGVEALVSDTGPPVRAVITLVVVRSLFWVLWRVRSAGLGFGDVRLSALVGLMLGRVGLIATGVGVYLPFLLLGLPGLVLALARRDRSLLRRAYPFGPFLVLGVYLGLVAHLADTMP